MDEGDTPISMDKVYRKYKDATMNPQKLMEELGIDITEGDNLGMSVVRKVSYQFHSVSLQMHIIDT